MEVGVSKRMEAALSAFWQFWPLCVVFFALLLLRSFPPRLTTEGRKTDLGTRLPQRFHEAGEKRSQNYVSLT